MERKMVNLEPFISGNLKFPSRGSSIAGSVMQDRQNRSAVDLKNTTDHKINSNPSTQQGDFLHGENGSDSEVIMNVKVSMHPKNETEQSRKLRKKKSGANLLSAAKNIFGATKAIETHSKHHKLPEDHRSSVIKRLGRQPQEELQQNIVLEPLASSDSPLFQQPIKLPRRLRHLHVKGEDGIQNKSETTSLGRSSSTRLPVISRPIEVTSSTNPSLANDDQWKRRGWRPATTYVENLKYLGEVNNDKDGNEENQSPLISPPSFTNVNVFDSSFQDFPGIQADNRKAALVDSNSQSVPNFTQRTSSMCSSKYSESIASVSSKASRVLKRIKSFATLKSRSHESRYVTAEGSPRILANSLLSNSSPTVESHTFSYLQSEYFPPLDIQFKNDMEDDEHFSDFDGNYHDASGDESDFATDNGEAESFFSQEDTSVSGDDEISDVESVTDGNEEEELTITINTRSLSVPSSVERTSSEKRGTMIRVSEYMGTSSLDSEEETLSADPNPRIQIGVDDVKKEYGSSPLIDPTTDAHPQLGRFLDEIKLGVQQCDELDKISTPRKSFGVALTRYDGSSVESELSACEKTETSSTAYLPKPFDLESFGTLLHYLSPQDLMGLVLTSKAVHDWVMQNVFEVISFDVTQARPPFIRFQGQLSQHQEITPTNLQIERPDENRFAQSQISRDLCLLCGQIKCLESMLYFTDSDGRRNPNRNSSFIRSIVFSGNWSSEGNWHSVVGLAEKLLIELPLENLKEFTWDLELPITSAIMTKVSTIKDGVLNALRLNGFAPKVKVLGDNCTPVTSDCPSLKTFRPSPLHDFKNLTTLELHHLQFAGNVDLDKKYVKEIFGVIIRSPQLTILKLHSVGKVALPTQNEIYSGFKRRATSKAELIIYPEAKKNQSTLFHAWIDMPALDRSLFEEAVHEYLRKYVPAEATAEKYWVSRRKLPGPSDSPGMSGREKQAEFAIPLYDKPLPPTPPLYSAQNEDRLLVRLNIKEVSLHGFALDGTIFNTPELSPGSVEKLSMLNCRYVQPKEQPHDVNAGGMTRFSGEHPFLAKQVIKGLKVLRMDKALLGSLGIHRTFDFLEEIFVPNEKDILNAKEVYIFESQYPEVDPNFPRFISGEEIQTVICSIMETQRNKYFVPSLSLSRTVVSVLALNPSWHLRLQLPELRRLIGTPEDGIASGLTELGVGVAENTWRDFLSLLPNLKNLVALHVYNPYTLNLPPAPDSTTTDPTNTSATIKDTSATVAAPAADALNVLFANVTDGEKARYVIKLDGGDIHIRRRFPVDDAIEIARAFILGASATKEKDMSRKIPLNDDRIDKLPRYTFSDEKLEEYFLYPRQGQRPTFEDFMLQKDEECRIKLKKAKPIDTYVKLKYVGVGQFFWKLLKVPDNSETSQTLNEVTALTTERGKWVLKRIFKDEADKDGVGIFRMGE